MERAIRRNLAAHWATFESQPSKREPAGKVDLKRENERRELLQDPFWRDNDDQQKRERARTNIELRRIPLYLPTTYLEVYHNVLVFELAEVLRYLGHFCKENVL